MRFENDTVEEKNVAVGRDSFQTLLFDSSNTWWGADDFNRTTGQYIAPSSGHYAFFLTVKSFLSFIRIDM